MRDRGPAPATGPCATPTDHPAEMRERADPTVVRRANLGVILRHLGAAGPTSRAGLAAATGLNKSTVSSLVAELGELGLVHDDAGADPGREPRVGRPATPVVLSGATVAVGAEINVDRLAVCLEDLTGAVRFETAEHVDLRASTPMPALERLAALASDTITRARADGLRVVGVGVAVPGLVDVASGTLLRAPNLGWTRVPIAEELTARLDLGVVPVHVSNEANLSALAELWGGAAQGLDAFVHVTGEVGVGSGIVIGGELYRGARGFAGELGHVTVVPGGLTCACGARGCLETVAGVEAIREAAGIVVPPGLGEHAVAQLIAGRAAAGDAQAVAALEAAGDALGSALAGAVNLLDLECVSLGGSFTPLSPWLGTRVRAVLDRHVLAADYSTFDVRPSALGGRAATRGAAAAVLRAVLDRPWLVEELDGAATRRRRRRVAGAASA
jgi:predicted NBD/HSP70 family sugar kinase